MTTGSLNQRRESGPGYLAPCGLPHRRITKFDQRQHAPLGLLPDREVGGAFDHIEARARHPLLRLPMVAGRASSNSPVMNSVGTSISCRRDVTSKSTKVPVA